MPSTLDALTTKGFKFVTVSELIALDRPAAPKAPAAPKPTAKAASSKPTPSADTKPVSKPAKEVSSTRKVAADKDVKTAPAASKNSGSTASASDSPKSNSAPKTAPLSQEELRKKWLQSMTQR
jgi:hypothetical protein